MTTLREIILWTGIALTVVAIFIFDIYMAPDDVSVAFMYSIPLFLSITSVHPTAYALAAVTTMLSIVGLFMLPPEADLTFHANRAIAVLVQWLIAALVTSRQRAEQLLHANLRAARMQTERQKRFLDIMSHEIGTSLTTIDGQAFRLSRRSHMLQPAEAEERSGKIRGAVRHIQALTQHIQLASEVENNVLRPHWQDISPATVVSDVVAQVRQAYPQAQIDIEADGMPRMLRGDSFMLSQIVENIVSNAAKYSPPEAPIVVTGKTADADFVLTVADKGRGIPADELNRVFAVYYRAQNTHGSHGSGVGLYVAERLAKALGGTITLESEIDAGTVVTVRLPLTPAAVAP